MIQEEKKRVANVLEEAEKRGLRRLIPEIEARQAQLVIAGKQVNNISEAVECLKIMLAIALLLAMVHEAGKGDGEEKKEVPRTPYKGKPGEEINVLSALRSDYFSAICQHRIFILNGAQA